MLGLLLSIYFSCLLQFSFVSHPIIYCILLLACCICGAGACYLVIGFSWYLILLCLVYIGGVYILFIFISIHNPNPNPSLGSAISVFFMAIPFFYYLFRCLSFNNSVLKESRHLLCSFFEGFSYCLLCLILLLGFLIISVVSRDKGSFYR